MHTATDCTQSIAAPAARSDSLRREWDAKYRSGTTPWDTRITPPEVKAFWRSDRISPESRSQQSSPGIDALDLGCGSGTNAAYLTGLGLRTVGIEISNVALAVARSRQAPLLAGGRLSFIQADATCMPLQNAQACYILDIGCLHGLSPGVRRDYAQSIVANLRPGGYYQLFAFDRQPDQGDERGLAAGELETLFTPVLAVVEAVQARPDMRACHWYLLQKPECVNP